MRKPIVDPEGIHRWSICEMCGPCVICGICGNSCCNGGSGRTVYEVDCDCTEAYAIQKAKFETIETELDKELFELQIKKAQIIINPPITYEFPPITNEEMQLLMIFSKDQVWHN